jgi:hypothetical protein
MLGRHTHTHTHSPSSHCHHSLNHLFNFIKFIYALTTRDDDKGRNATTARVQGGGQARPAAVGEEEKKLRGERAKVRARFDPLRPRYRQTTVRKTRSSGRPRAVSTPSLTRPGRTPRIARRVVRPGPSRSYVAASMIDRGFRCPPEAARRHVKHGCPSDPPVPSPLPRPVCRRASRPS